MKEHKVIPLTDIGRGAGIVQMTYIQRAIKMKHFRETWGRISEQSYEELEQWILGVGGIVLKKNVTTGYVNAVYEVQQCVCKIIYEHGASYDIAIASDYEDEVTRFEEQLMKRLPIIKAEDNRIPISFWALGSRGPTSRNRRIDVPSWSDIKQNYPKGVLESLDELMNLKPDKSGQLILFHGEPGTGKSYAIRTLLNEWRDWCNSDYIVDPEKFFGSSAEYMMTTLLSCSGLEDGFEDYPPSQPIDENGKNPADFWRLFIIEDGDEFLTDDAKVRSGQALSRLLNVVDGMIGQGLRILVLVTTNEPLGRLHPAVTRPGRCLANIEFRTFTYRESLEWFKKNNIFDSEIKNDNQTLAELYHQLGTIKSVKAEKKKRKVGFVE